MDDPSDVSGPAERSNPDKNLHDELIFRQDLNEIHLLIDFVSGRADRSLNTLSMPDPADPTKTMGPGEIVRRISQMRYPPDDGPVVNAQNAAILLMAKDRLSALAAPARGVTIAYTTMFIDAEAGRETWSHICRWLRNYTGRKVIDSQQATDYPLRDTRFDLAQRTFPGLLAHARKFRVWRDRLAWFTILWLILTALAYWDAGLGRAALERLDLDWKKIVEELNDNPTLIHCPDVSVETARTDANVQLDDAVVRRQFACRKYNYLRIVGKTAGKQVNDVFRCENMKWTQIAHVWCWSWLLSGTAEQSPNDDRQPATGQARVQQPGLVAAVDADGQRPRETPSEAPSQVSPYARANVAYWQTATAILSVFTTYMLPMMFALLGTLIGAFRAILNRVGASELAPRDLVRMKIGVPTGLVAGIAVGLFLSPTSVPVQGAGGVGGQFTLTACGLGFLAGYASQSFFNYLDNLLGTVFPNAAAARTVANPADAIIAASAASAIAALRPTPVGSPTPAVDPPRPAPGSGPPQS